MRKEGEGGREEWGQAFVRGGVSCGVEEPSGAIC